MEKSGDRVVLAIHEGNLEEVYRRYIHDFAPEELKSYEQLEYLLKNKKYKLLLAKDGDEMVGYAFIYELSLIPAIWLDYIAIDESCRNRGYGTQFLNKIGASMGIFMEVEIPVKGPSEKDQLRRVRFYERLGAKRLHLSYQLPTSSGGFPMFLYFRTAANFDQLPKESLQAAITEVFENIHSDVENRNAILREILLSIDIG